MFKYAGWVSGTVLSLTFLLLTHTSAVAQDADEVMRKLKLVSPEAMERAIGDRETRFRKTFKRVDAEQKLTEIKRRLPQAMKSLETKDTQSIEEAANILTLYRQFMIDDNPAVDFEKLYFIRAGKSPRRLPTNWQSNSKLSKFKHNNVLAELNIKSPDKTLDIYRPPGGAYIGEIDLHFDADRILFSSIGANDAWHLFEMNIGANTARQVTPSGDGDVNHYDGCYLPDDRLIFNCTALGYAVPCVDGDAPVTNLFRINPDGSGMEMLTNDQDHNWHPAIMSDGRVLYTRWEYADLPHSNSRFMFTCNPDGTNQKAYYGSNSNWPNSTFYAQPIPGKPTQFIGVISGHHGVSRIGELVIFDPDVGTYEAEGALQRIPGYGKKVEKVVADQLVNNSWPKFLHPMPIDENNFLVTMQPDAKSEWGIYIVDRFDNLALIREERGMLLHEPTPIRKRKRPPIIPDRIDPKDKEATVYIADIYKGPGLKDVPRGEVKALRVYTYTYGSRGQGGLYGSIGADGPWDMRRILGTVNVHEDGSAMFKVPAMTPIAIQPLDKDGRAMQIMRSWFTARQGEGLLCIGCHEDANELPPATMQTAARRPAQKIKPWYGATRNFEFAREVQPVIDRHCIGCHDGRAGRPDLRGDVMIKNYKTKMSGAAWTGTGGKFSVGYWNLFRFIRTPGIESDMRLTTPMEYHVSASDLIMLLEKGHYGVKLDSEGMARIVTWIDLNAPYHGRWDTLRPKTAQPFEKIRADRRALYAGIVENHEHIDAPIKKLEFVAPSPLPPVPEGDKHAPNWPFDAATAQKMQAKAPFTLELGNGVTMEFVYVPAGSFVMGSTKGYRDELPTTQVSIAKGYWIGKTEVTNRQFRAFKPEHNSQNEDRMGYYFGITGFEVDGDDLPAVRLSWNDAQDYCRRFTEKTGRKAFLPTEAQWEWAARAGSTDAFWFGGVDSDFTKYANLADRSLHGFSANPYVQDPVKARYNNPDWTYDNYIPQAPLDDGGFLTEKSGKWQPNAWGICDMHGNAAEWTRSLYRPYPYKDDDGRNDLQAQGERVVRGGSWRDRPKHATASFRRPYRPYHKVYNTGFRVVIEE